jgi:hypothetical protein
MGEDLETLAELPDGTLYIDVLSGKAEHSVAGTIDLYIASEIQAWFKHRLEVSDIPRSEIQSALVLARINTGRITTNRKKVISFDFNIESKIETTKTLYFGELREAHQWHQRVPSNKRMQSDAAEPRR